MKKLPLLLVAAGLLLPGHSKLMADEEGKKSEYRLEYKVAKKRVKEDRKEKEAREQAPGGEDTEMWLYKVQVENKSLSDVEGLEVQYTIYLSPLKSSGGRGGPPGGGGGGGGRPGGAQQGEEPSVRTVTGEASLDIIERGDRVTFETTPSAVSKGGKQRGGPPGGGRGGPGGGGKGGQGGQGGGPQGQNEAGKLDGIKIELYLDGEKVDEHIYGSAAKRAAAAEKKSLKKAERDEREHREEDEN